MTSDQIRQVILEILERIAPDEDLTDLDDVLPFREQMELDSMDFLDIVLELRKLYRLQIPEEDYPNLNTMAGNLTPKQSGLFPLRNRVCRYERGAGIRLLNHSCSQQEPVRYEVDSSRSRKSIPHDVLI
jgi:acyl carrier protein